VQLLQTALSRAGVYEDAADGVFCQSARTAVRAFQDANALTSDGIVGRDTWRALKPYLNRTLTYAVKPGDTLSALAARQGVTLGEVLAANPLIADPDYIFPGLILTLPWPGSVITSAIAYSSEIMAANIAALQSRFGFLECSVAGASLLGRDILYLRFGRGGVNVVYNAAHHANEWITAPHLMRFIEQLCTAKARGEELLGIPANRLYDLLSLYAVPMVNPDGVDLVTGQLKPDSAAYQQAYAIRGELPFPSGWKANIRGVDLNNNYPALFEKGKEEKEKLGTNRPGPRDYTGSHALSEPESAHMVSLTNAVNPALTIALHTQGREIYWRFESITPPGSLRIGEAMAAASGYTLTDPPGASYGGYKDWFILAKNRPGFTVEAGQGVNPLPIEDFEEDYKEVAPILMAGMREILRSL
jgi:g-D-glutamyl-meso-diaminopimelate peptidase